MCREKERKGSLILIQFQEDSIERYKWIERRAIKVNMDLVFSWNGLHFEQVKSN